MYNTNLNSSVYNGGHFTLSISLQHFASIIVTKYKGQDIS
jgi:hypothetical protein